MSVDQLGRAYQAYRRTAGSRSMAALLIANAIPLVGVLFFGWSLLTILVIYWLENGIVGFWNVPKIVLAQGSMVPPVPPMPDAAAYAEMGTVEAAKQFQANWEAAREAQARAAEVRVASGTAFDVGANPAFTRMYGSGRMPGVGRAALAFFFLFHYGMFWLVHGIFVFTLPMFLGGRAGFGPAECFADPGIFPPGAPGLPGADACAGSAFGEVLWGNVAIAGVALFLSHGASFLFNYIGNAEYVTASPTRQMGAVYGRVVVLHLTIIFGAFAVASLGSPVAALLLLTGLKTAFDLALHRREHRSAANRIPANTTFGQIVRGA